MNLDKLTYIILELNAAMDSGKYDAITLQEACQHVDARDVITWLSGCVPDMDLTLLTPVDVEAYQAALSDINGAYGGTERRKWGVERRALCLLIALTNELVQRRRFDDN
jgi:hypothetical protein